MQDLWNMQYKQNREQSVQHFCQEKRPFGKLSKRWIDNIKMDVRVIGSEGMNLNEQTPNKVQ
jgi:hypothetical protein